MQRIPIAVLDARVLGNSGRVCQVNHQPGVHQAVNQPVPVIGGLDDTAGQFRPVKSSEKGSVTNDNYLY